MFYADCSKNVVKQKEQRRFKNRWQKSYKNVSLRYVTEFYMHAKRNLLS
jgi:hypothetical protein